MSLACTDTSLNRLTAIAATLFGMPGSTVVLSGADGMTLQGGVNVCRDDAPKKASFTDEALKLGRGGVLVVEDASVDPRFADNPLVAGSAHVRFFCGAVITLKSGRHVGTLCVLDVEPRAHPDHVRLEALKNLADMAADILDRDADSRRQAKELEMIDLAEAMSGVGHWRLSVASEKLRWSDEVFRIHGLDPAAGEPDLEAAINYYHPDDRETVRGQLAAVSATGVPMQFELTLIREDGEERLVQSCAAVERGADGEVVSLYGVFRDITEERRTLIQAQRSESRYRLLADSMADVITRMQRDGTATYISPAVEQLLGWPAGEMSGQARDYIHPEDCPKVMAVIAAVLDGSDRTTVVHRARHRDGHYVWAESRFQRIKVKEGQPEEVIVVIRDVSRRKALEDQLKAALAQSRESEAKYRLLADRSQDVIVTYGYDMRITYVSPAVEQISGKSPGEVIGAPVVSLIHPDDVDAAIENLTTFLRDCPNEDQFSQRYRAITKTGEVRHFETRTRIARDEGGRVTEIQDVVRDITETRRLEEELRDALVKAEAAGRAKAEFLANMSHELRTPLTSVVGFAGLLKASSHLTGQDRRHVERIATGSEALLSVINDILDYSKLEAEALKVDPHPFNLWDLAYGAGDLMEAQRVEKGLDLRIEIDAEAPHVLQGDEGRLRQVTLNFLSNAMKFTRQGAVVLKVGGVPLADGGWRLRIAVTDTGIGIAPDKLPTLFERFTQADQSTTRHFGGTGLGLAISKRLIEAMGGEIGAESRPGQGSTFWFEVPLQTGHTVAAAPAEPVSRRVESARVLVADDASANRELVSAILAQLGIETEVACNGVEALAAVQVMDFDLVLMDMHMPEMDGLEAARRIRALGGLFRRLPIIALTANVQDDQIQTCLEAGMDGHVGKPINIAELAGTIAHWLEAGRSDDDTVEETAA